MVMYNEAASTNERLEQCTESIQELVHKWSHSGQVQIKVQV